MNRYTRLGDSLVYRMKPDDHAALFLGSFSFEAISREEDEKEFLFTTTLPTPSQSGHIPTLIVSSILVAVVFLAIGLFAYWKKPDDRRVLVFYLLSAAAAVYFFLNPVEQLTSMNALGFKRSGLSTLEWGSFVWSFLFIPLLLHMALIFPKPRPAVTNNPYLFRWLYGMPILLPALVISLALVELLHQSEISKTISGPGSFYYSLHGIRFGLPFEIVPLPPVAIATLDALAFLLAVFMLWRWWKSVKEGGWRQWPLTTMLAVASLAVFLVSAVETITRMLQLGPQIPKIIFVLWLILAFISLVSMVLYYPIKTFSALRDSYRESGVEEKRQIRWPVLATIIAVCGPFVIVIVSIGYYFLFAREPNALFVLMAEVLINTLYIFVPLGFAFAIFKYRLMDIDLIIKKTVIYAAVTGVIVMLYLGLVAGLGGFLMKSVAIKNQWVIIFSTLVVALVFVPLRNRVQNVVDRRFFRKKYDYPTALKNLTRELSQVVELQALLKLVVEHLQPALQNRSVVIFSRGTYDRAYVATAKVGLPDEILGQLKFELGSPLLAMMDSPFEVRTQDLPAVEKLTLRKTGSAFIVPVKLKNELVGFISVGTKLSDEDYDAEDKDFLISVAEQMGAGVERIRLREQERDFEKAREIQQGLLPKQIPQLPGYEIACAWQPARAVAGDYYDVIKLSESALGICIADVVGKGMPAALLMSNLQAIVRAMASEDMPPKQLCEKVNRVISSNMTPGKFITFFYCLLDAKQKKLIYSNAGHNRPILFHQDGTWLELKEGGLALGMSRERNYEQGEAELNSGDRLLLFTDGVTEAINADREEFGEERLIELLGNNLSLRATELQKKVIEAVTEFSRGDFQDDVTLIAISVE